MFQHEQPLPDKIDAAGQLDKEKGVGRCRYKGREADGAKDCVTDCAGADAQSRYYSRLFSLADASSHDVEIVRAGKEIQHDAGGDKEKRIDNTKHMGLICLRD